MGKINFSNQQALTAERLREVLDYEPEAGLFTWKVTLSNRAKAGSTAGNINNIGYRMIQVDGRRYLASRLAYLYMMGEWPEHEIDHKDLNRSNDAWENLRPATPVQNAANTKMQSNNTSGYKGVYLIKKRGRWLAQIVHNGKQIFLGYYESAEEAAIARETAAEVFHGEFARCE